MKRGPAWKGMTNMLKSSFEQPKPHCCIVYSEKHFKGQKGSVCVKEDGTPNLAKFAFRVGTLDCGANTSANWSHSMSEAANFYGTAGRVTEYN